MQKTWKKIERYLAKARPELLEVLRSPASPGAVEEAARQLGVALPEPLQASLIRHDGMDAERLVDLWRLLSLAEIVEEHRGLVHLLDAGEFAACSTEHDKKVLDGWFRRGWIPFAADGFGNLLCVDTEPGPRGKPGQVIEYWQDDAERAAVSASLLAWMRKVARDLPAQEVPKTPRPIVVEHDGASYMFRNPGAAQRCAVKGETDLAVAGLRRFLELEDVSSAAALSLISAFQGDWAVVLELSARVLANTGDFYHSNVPMEHLHLMVRAGAVTGQWETVAAAMEGVPQESYGFMRSRVLRCCQAGKDLINTLDTEPARPEEEYARDYAERLAAGPPSTYSATELEKRRWLFNLALACRRWDVVRELVSAHPEVCWLDDLKELAPFFEPDELWPMVLSSLPQWYPPYQAQVVPAELVLVPILRDLMTRERCEQILSTPRVRHWWDFGR
jgi:cell wall assembly regulator SMI1